MIYLDTSILVALFTNEANSISILEWYEANDTLDLVTADWTLSEFASALSFKWRKKRHMSERDAENAQAAFNALVNGGIRLLSVSRGAFQHSPRLIRQMENLRAGDALHFAVALEAGAASFATLDKALAGMVGQSGMDVVSFD